MSHAPGHTTDRLGPEWPRAELQEPSGHGFLLIGVTTGGWTLPFTLPSHRRRALLVRLHLLAQYFSAHGDVVRADVFRGLVRPPGTQAGIGTTSRAPRHDAVLLVETTTPRAADRLADDRLVLHQLHDTRCEVVAAKNVRRMGDVDRDRAGVFLFNFFAAADVDENIAQWQHTAGWFATETGLDNSLVLQPLDPSSTDHSIVNFCRWDRLTDVLPALTFKRSFHSYVLDTFRRHRIAPRPLLYRLDG